MLFRSIGNHYHYVAGTESAQIRFVKFSSHYDFSAIFPAGAKTSIYTFHNHTASNYLKYESNFSSNSFSKDFGFISSLAIGTAAQEAHENRPPYYALYYIMKLE